jgi:hypothetical protein
VGQGRRPPSGSNRPILLKNNLLRVGNFAGKSFCGLKPAINGRCGILRGIEPGDRRKAVVPRLIQIAAFIKP